MITIDGKRYPFREGRTVMEAAEESGIYIPKLCTHPSLPPSGACRLCLIKIEGMTGLPTSCTTPAREGMVITTEDPELRRLRRGILELILLKHPNRCFGCERCVTNCVVCSYLDSRGPRARSIMEMLDSHRDPLDGIEIWCCAACHRCAEGCPVGSDPLQACADLKARALMEGKVSRGIMTMSKNILETGYSVPVRRSTRRAREKEGLPPLKEPPTKEILSIVRRAGSARLFGLEPGKTGNSGDTGGRGNSEEDDTGDGTNSEEDDTGDGTNSEEDDTGDGTNSEEDDTGNGTNSEEDDTGDGTNSEEDDTRNGTNSEEDDTGDGTNSEEDDTGNGIGGAEGKKGEADTR